MEGTQLVSVWEQVPPTAPWVPSARKEEEGGVSQGGGRGLGGGGGGGKALSYPKWLPSSYIRQTFIELI